MENLVPIFVVLMLYAPIAYFLTRSFPAVERSTILKIITLALFARLGLAFFLALFIPAGYFGPDSIAYIHDGNALATFWSGESSSLNLIKLNPSDTKSGYYYFIAYQYYYFGFIKYFPAFVNGLLGTISILMLVKLAHQFFAFTIVKRLALFLSFFPSLILFNSYVLKDTLVATLVVIALYNYIQFLYRRSWPSLLVVVLTFVPLYSVRFYMVFMLLIVFFFSSFLMAGEFSIKRITRSLIAASFIFTIAFASGIGGEALDTVEKEANVKRMNYYQSSLKEGASATFEGQEYKTGGDIVRYLPIRLTYFLFAPFPWQITSTVAFMAFLELPFWWFLFPSTIRGFKFLLAHPKTRIFMPFLVFTLLVSVFYALIESNIGTFYRKKAQVLPFFFMMASAGLAIAEAKKKNFSTEYLLAPEHRFKAD